MLEPGCAYYKFVYLGILVNTKNKIIQLADLHGT
jgi:hypothetical protein